ncbi:hypothetical protein M422DRAFT_253586 [Sphaerobolus stellatus SS14]|uniref:Uncharacterized protein n=1 Tax=Sphaerobolus stellatus (strain SS14) TaxID=990650 RepID=A0A0C9V7T0_SPHS4|nr:hypothetical protein M422DRAFT_253586 [Sphaerobolus stellatus SS14]
MSTDGGRVELELQELLIAATKPASMPRTDPPGWLFSPAFLAFSLNASTPQKIEIPRTKDDIKMDEQLSLLFEFLSTLKKPPELDETAAK